MVEYVARPTVIVKSLSNDNGNGNVNKNGKKTQHSTVVGLISQTTTSHVHHAFLYISLPSLHDYNVKNAEFQVGLGREHKISTFFFFT